MRPYRGRIVRRARSHKLINDLATAVVLLFVAGHVTGGEHVAVEGSSAWNMTWPCASKPPGKRERRELQRRALAEMEAVRAAAGFGCFRVVIVFTIQKRSAWFGQRER